MEKVVFMFPGVGSQYTGMGKSFFDNFKIARDTLEEASDILKCNMIDLCFSQEKKSELNKLENAQCTIFAISVAIYRVFTKETGIKPCFGMGHSLGEYSALCCAGAINFDDSLRLVKERGKIINYASKSINGTMTWVINLDYKIVEEVCCEICKEGHEIYISAYDSSYQSSISGHVDTVMKAARKLERKGALIYPLKMSGPFHCPLMVEAEVKMKSILDKYKYNSLLFPVIANNNALPYEGIESISNNLAAQLTSPVRWRESIEYVTNKGVSIAIEIGPKNVLTFLMKKNVNSIKIYCSDNINELKKLKEEWL